MMRGARWQRLVVGILAFLLGGVAWYARADAPTTLTLSVIPPTVAAGEEVAITITVTQSLPLELPVSLRLDLPPGMAYVPGSAQVWRNGVPVQPGAPTVAGSTLLWERLMLPPGNVRNLRGINTFVQDHCADAGLRAWQLDRARELVGPGGLVKQLVYPIALDAFPDVACWQAFVRGAYARGMDVLLRLQGAHTGALWAPPASSGSPPYAAIAQRYRDFVAQMPREDGRTLYIQVWNEPNMNEEWGGRADPVAYARFFVAVSNAIRSLGDARVRVLNAPLAPGGHYDNLAFLDAMLTVVPEFLWAFDAWAAHAYPGNHPPEYNHHQGTAQPGDRATIDAYLLEVARLRQRGRAHIPVVISETGYALGAAPFGWQGYPPVDEQNRATYMRRAFSSYWRAWPEIVAVAPFQLSDPDREWWRWDWVAPYGAPTLQYHAVRELGDTFAAEGTLVVRLRSRVPEPAQPTLLTLAATLRAEGQPWSPLSRRLSLLVLPAATPSPTPTAEPTPTPVPTVTPTVAPPPVPPAPVPSPTVVASWPAGIAPRGLGLDDVREWLFVADADQAQVRVLDVNTGETVRVVSLPGYWGLHNLAWVRGERYLLATVRLAGAALLLPEVDPARLRFVSLGAWPTGVAVAEDVGRAFISDSRSHTVSVLSLREARLLATVPIPHTPMGLAYDPGRQVVYVAQAGAETVTVLDARTLEVVDRVQVGAAPVDVAVFPRRGWVVVVSRVSRTLALLAGTERWEVPLACTPRRVAVLPAWARVYVLCEDVPGLEVWDAAQLRLVARVPLGPGMGEDVLVDRARARVYVSLSGAGNVLVVQDTKATLTARRQAHVPYVVQGRAAIGAQSRLPESLGWRVWPEAKALVRMDPARRAVVRRVALGARPLHVAYDPAGRWAFVTLPEASALACVDLARGQVVGRVSLPGLGVPTGVTATRAGVRVMYLLTPRRTADMFLSFQEVCQK